MSATESKKSGTASNSTASAAVFVVPDDLDPPTLQRVGPEVPPITRSITLSRESTSVGKARRYVKACARDHPRQDDIELATSELSGNAIQHGARDEFTVTVTTMEDGMSVTVTNWTDGIDADDLDGLEDGDEMRMPVSEHGRGLHVVSAVAELTVRMSAFFPNRWTAPAGEA